MGFWGGGGSPKKKQPERGGHLKKIREKGGHIKYCLYCRGVHGEKFSYLGGVMQLSNDTSKNSTSTPYLVKKITVAKGRFMNAEISIYSSLGQILYKVMSNKNDAAEAGLLHDHKDRHINFHLRVFW